mgnify:CR=1 FL=1
MVKYVTNCLLSVKVSFANEVAHADNGGVGEHHSCLALQAHDERPAKSLDIVEDESAPVRAVGDDGDVRAERGWKGGVHLSQDIGDGTTPCPLSQGDVLWPRAHGDGDDEALPSNACDDGVQAVVDGGLVEDDPDRPPTTVWPVMAIAEVSAGASTVRTGTGGAGSLPRGGDAMLAGMRLMGGDAVSKEGMNRARCHETEEAVGVKACVVEGARDTPVNAGDPGAWCAGLVAQQGVGRPGDVVGDAVVEIGRAHV